MKLSTLFGLTLIMYCTSATWILALTSPMSQNHPLAAGFALIGGFIGTSIFFTDITRSETKQVNINTQAIKDSVRVKTLNEIVMLMWTPGQRTNESYTWVLEELKKAKK